MKTKRAESKAMVAEWQAQANRETKKERFARLARHEAGTVLTQYVGRSRFLRNPVDGSVGALQERPRAPERSRNPDRRRAPAFHLA
jgi:hypothetical protein